MAKLPKHSKKMTQKSRIEYFEGGSQRFYDKIKRKESAGEERKSKEQPGSGVEQSGRKQTIQEA